MRFLSLTQGEFAKVDDADFADVSRWNWCVHESKGSHTRYAGRGRTKEESERDGTTSMVLLHRYLLGEPDAEVDHVNGDGLDCRRKDLRVASHLNNMRNSRSRAGSSRFKGVSLEHGKWSTRIRVNYRTVHLGRFTLEEEAALAYDDAARRYHGAFARLNFPRTGEQPALQD